MKRILVVEDNELNRELVTQLLEDDYEVAAAADGAAGLTAAVKLRPDLILMDLSLPVLDGWEVTRRPARRSVDGRRRPSSRSPRTLRWRTSSARWMPAATRT